MVAAAMLLVQPALKDCEICVQSSVAAVINVPGTDAAPSLAHRGEGLSDLGLVVAQRI